MPGMIRAPGFVREAQARDLKAAAAQELADYVPEHDDLSTRGGRRR